MPKIFIDKQIVTGPDGVDHIQYVACEEYTGAVSFVPMSCSDDCTAEQPFDFKAFLQGFLGNIAEQIHEGAKDRTIDTVVCDNGAEWSPLLAAASKLGLNVERSSEVHGQLSSEMDVHRNLLLKDREMLFSCKPEA